MSSTESTGNTIVASTQPTASTPLTTHAGSCHCGTVTFTVRSPAFPGQVVVSCNCSICSTHGYLLIYRPHEDFVFTAGEDRLRVYSFPGVHKGKIGHWFCPECGTSVYAASTDPGYHGAGFKAVNVRTLKDVDLRSLELKLVDGRSL
ncbi:hypothetical protein EJ05DRAFT_477736 [Pseudovirgaria hyperparasitica]|uniref:CENP-V/GFA domain-containing protein n=1 Tax=Pseudovirgaria hyperparasitica TaxID=470096 RepID=A0A6A6W3B6_9PEZI|nr:uncharacterized protein EJ05DRAFT_477736 [Pseudovirgaria hyperparasitica]KAF2756629.1 hypothetical protein EJ05DRAFT_477736 [Pseudovirgaria hyperparasitica]